MNMILTILFMEARYCRNNKGYMTLAGILILGAIGTAIILNVIMSGLESSRAGFTLIQSVKSDNLTNACLETALKKIEGETNFEGGEILSFNSGVCRYDVIKQSGENRTVNAYGIIGDVTRKKKIEINKISPTISIVSWRDVVSF